VGWREAGGNWGSAGAELRCVAKSWGICCMGVFVRGRESGC